MYFYKNLINKSMNKRSMFYLGFSLIKSLQRAGDGVNPARGVKQNGLTRGFLKLKYGNTGFYR
ncbi:hypothetical protein J6TS2_46810 [Heyndrickxia sporothermodurans]|nr:hypothetical protein J6TS2_46810 [Heyndrickxia sporothermodurans]